MGLLMAERDKERKEEFRFRALRLLLYTRLTFHSRFAIILLIADVHLSCVARGICRLSESK